MSGGGDKVKETRVQKEEARQGLEQQKRYVDKFLPLERELIADVRDTRDERGQALSDASSETTRAFGLAKPKVEAAMTNAGARPGSARFALGVTGMGEDEGSARGMSLVGANNAVDDQYYAGLESLAAMGRGQQAESLQGLSRLSRMSADQAVSDASLSAQNRAGWLNAAGGLAGVAAGVYTKRQSANPVQPMEPMQPISYVQPPAVADFPNTPLPSFGGN